MLPPHVRGKRVVLTSYVDANLYHDWVNCKSVTAVLHSVNQTPVEWFSQKQPTETATYGSEFTAAKTAAQQIMGLCTMLRYLGVQVHGCTRLSLVTMVQLSQVEVSPTLHSRRGIKGYFNLIQTKDLSKQVEGKLDS